MSTSRFLGVMAVLSTVIVTPVATQPVMTEPGYCAFFYPNANCQNKGPGNPYTDPNHQRSVNQGYVSAPGQTVGVAPKRPRAPAMRAQ